MSDLRTKTSRARLKLNTNGYPHNLAPGRALLYRKRTAGYAGKWMLRTVRPQGGYSFEVLGTADDFDDGLSYRQALEIALDRTSANSTKLTVEAALDAWVKRKTRTAASRKRVNDLHSGARRINDAFPRASLSTLTARAIQDWMDKAVDAADDQRARMATMNRQLAAFKAALTAFADANGYEGKRAWLDVKLYAKSDSFGSRKLILTEAQESALIAASEPDLALMLTALQMTGARYGEMRKALVGDLVGDRLDLSGKTGKRTIVLSADFAAFFAGQAENRPAVEPLLRRVDLGAWGDGDQVTPTRRARVAAGLPDDVVTYTLRHGFISRALAKGVPVSAVAAHCGTSVAMIESSYAKYVASDVKEWFA